MLVVCPYLRRNIRVGEDRELTTRLGRNSRALNVLIGPKPNVHGRVTHCLEQMSARMLVKHTLTERAKLLPFITAILATK